MVNRQFPHHVQPRVSHLTNENLLCKCCTLQDVDLGQESFKCEKWCQPQRTGPHLDHCHQTGPGHPKLSTAMYILIGTYIGWRHYISLWTKCSRAKISGFLQPFLVSKPHNHWRPILGLSKPNLSETMRATLQQWEWVTLKDFKDAYFHVPIQEQSGTCQILWLGWDIQVQSTVFQSVHCTHGSYCSSKGDETDGYAQGYKKPPVPR